MHLLTLKLYIARLFRIALPVLLACALCTCMVPGASAQYGFGPPEPPPEPTLAERVQEDLNEGAGGAFNPVTALEQTADAIPGFEGGLSGTLNIMVLLTVLTLVPSIMIMTTSFIRFIIVLGLLRQAIGTPTMPPGQVVTALALMMTAMVMAPTIERINNEALVPYRNGEITNQLEMWDRAKLPLRDFMFDQIEAADNWSSVYMVLNYQGVDTSEPENLTRADVDTMSLIPAYMLSELKIAFLMGFRVYLPFLVIDMVIAALLISMSMMMLPPVLISLPFKLMLFVLVDGWQLVVGNLLASVAVDSQGSGVGVISTITGGG